MKKLAPLLALTLVLLISGCVQQGQDQDQTQLANPSAVYCEEQGYRYEIRTTPEGEAGFCIFPDGSECPGWDYYNGVCSPGGQQPICIDMCGDGVCQEVVCLGEGCPCAETPESCPEDCAPAASYTDVTPAEAKTLIESMPDLVIIDVSPYYEEGHIPGAVNYYVGDGSLDAAIPTLDKEKPYLVYCHFDSAAILGAQILVDAGFTNVYRLEGNYTGWVDAGYDTEA